jgi:predicted SAM-dependent methyltransferase
MPWLLKLIIKIILSRFNVSYKYWQRFHLFRHGAMDNVDYAIKVFNSHKSYVENLSLTNKTVLELGPGDSIATSIICSAYGAKSILVDNADYAIKNLKFYKDLNKKLKSNNKQIKTPNIDPCKSIYEVLDVCNSKYLLNGLKSLKSLQSNSIELIFSQSVLQHILLNEFYDTMIQCFRILKQGGVCSHEIVLHDHLGGNLNNLRFRKIIWESNLFKTSGFYTNRIRYSEMIKIFKNCGFKVNVIKKSEWATIPVQRKHINHRFRDFSNNDLCISKFNVLLEK